ncbi:erythromycin esterase family protein [Actinoallomurus sp. CA-150999]|uniref:erythromycin esterase family protein n=1 Tax=Actinoallomurus sp. CA-150999 TaxID=3239887 RepID=UPI003D8AD6E9
MTEESSAGDVTGWLARNALPLHGLVAGAPTTDLQPLKDVLPDVRVVGLGEATHGTREFFQLKHRLLEFLVTELGFSVFAMEASASAGAAVDAYIRHGIGNAANVLTRLGFWTWRTEEVLAMIEWMRAYNQGRPEEDKVGFVGIDPQQCGDSIKILEAFLRETAPERVAALHATLGVLGKASPGSQPDPERRLVREAEDLLEFVRTQDPDAVEAIRHADILVKAADLVTRVRRHTDPEQTVFAARDRYMADAVADLLDEPSVRVVLWAHNGHVANHRFAGGVPTMGSHLHARYGDAYYALGLLFGRGDFRARRGWPGPWQSGRGRKPVPNSVDSAPPATLEAQLAAAQPGDHLVDLRATADAPEAVRAWARDRRPSRTFGSLVPRGTYRFAFGQVVPAEDYDGLAYVAVSSSSRLLPPA